MTWTWQVTAIIFLRRSFPSKCFQIEDRWLRVQGRGMVVFNCNYCTFVIMIDMRTTMGTGARTPLLNPPTTTILSSSEFILEKQYKDCSRPKVDLNSALEVPMEASHMQSPYSWMITSS